ncbi:hypothetical protein POTG_03853 [Paenibacillus sp. oral taxon 786 str. D14]|uniref:glycosyltransferase n=1 Tax=Paenibacillus sp. oral taxon 786 TaxID=652715 RepID=UPI0001AFD925|nr:glycosyltransferase [Paenibacillus sp. oral taxon 786]EES71520.1 hypothetical protein POTG_03853 [Paenibacillus sp. oral taxon 786 str. D14]
MSKRIVIESNFNTFGFSPHRLTRPWLENRIQIFREFTLKSLLVQTNQDFMAIFKVVPETEKMINEILAKYPRLPKNIMFVTHQEGMERIKTYAGSCENLYLVRMESDDMYHKSYIQQLHDHRPKPGTLVLINQNGYAYDSIHGEMVPMFRKSPPYYVFLYKTSEFTSGYRIKLPGRATHGNVIELPHEILTPRNFVEVIHRYNSIPRTLPVRGRLSKEEQKKVLKEFMG